MNSIEDRLKIVMAGLSGRKFAAMLGMSSTTVNQYLNGRMPPADFIVLVCERFRVNSWWLLTGQGEIKDLQGEQVSTLAEPVIHYSTDRQADVLHHKLQRILDEGDPGKLEMIKVQLKHLDPGPKKQELSNEQNSGTGVAGNHAA